MRVSVEQRLRGHDLARRADTALEAPIVEKRLLQRVQAIVLSEPLDRGNLGAIRHYGQRDARTDRLAVEYHGASAASAYAATLLCPGKSEVVADKVDQQTVVGNFAANLIAVHANAYALHLPASFARNAA